MRVNLSQSKALQIKANDEVPTQDMLVHNSYMQRKMHNDPQYVVMARCMLGDHDNAAKKHC